MIKICAAVVGSTPGIDSNNWVYGMPSIRLRTSCSTRVRCSRLASASPATKDTPSSVSQAPGSQGALGSHGSKTVP